MSTARDRGKKKTTLELPNKLYQMIVDAAEEEFLNLRTWLIIAAKEKLDKD